VRTGYDAYGTFGGADSALDGMSFVATFTYDTTLGALNTSSDDDSQLSSGLTGSPILSRTLTINGVTINRMTKSIVASTYSYIVDNLYTSNNYIAVSAQSESLGDPYDSLFMYIGSNPDEATSSFDTIIPFQSRFVGGHFSFSRSSVYVQMARVYGSFDSFGSVSVTNGAVPEPATWALMIGGFGMVGAAARRRRSMVAV
jgi:hypothetical protein